MYRNALSAATFAVIDVETTGLDAAADRVVEVACLRLRCGRVTERFSSLVDPQRAIPARASQIHGIFARDVLGAPTLGHLEPRLRELTRDAVVVAHNARFDVGFLPFVSGRPTLCTLQLARRLVDAPNYRNETLRDFLKLQVPKAAAHRAAADAEVTAALLLELLRRYERGPYERTVAGVFQTLARPAFVERFAFGAHRGRSVRHVPTGYLRWIVRADFDNWPDVRHTALSELARREGAGRSAPVRRFA